MAGFQFDILSREEIDKIVDGAFRVMEDVGMAINNDEARGILRRGGAEENGDSMRIPRSLTRDCLGKAPSRIDIFNRRGEPAMSLTGRNSYFGPGVTCPNFFDPYTLERRPATKKDVETTAVIADGLDNVDFLMSLCMISDMTPTLADIHEVHAMLSNSNKPILAWTFNRENLADIVDLAIAATGGEKAFREKPSLIVYSEPTTPLFHSREALDKVIFLAERGIPCVYSPGMTFGGTAPVTPAGALTVGLADVFTGVVLSQLVNPGTGIILSSNGGVLDMQSIQGAYGSPEMSLVDAAGTQIIRSLGLPTFGLAGATDAKSLDAQAAMESTAEILMYLGAGANLIHDLGMMDVGMTGSVQLLVFCDEVISFARRLTRGFAVDEEALAFEVVKKVGPGGVFLSEKHTRDHFRKEMFIPELGLRKSWDAWERDGSKSMADLAREKAIRLLENHRPDTPDAAAMAAMDAIVMRAETRVAAGGSQSAPA
jgi:trimethylamine--corrinoid protein Co-methyltransferase